MSYPCNIIQDLLPSYVDGLCSAQSQQAVEEHVRGCEPCRQMLDAMQAKEYELPDPAQNLKKKRPFQKLRNRVLSLIMAVVLVCGSVSVFFLYNQNFYYQYLHWGDRIHINLTVNDIDASVPIEECVAFSYAYIGDDLDAPIKIREILRQYTSNLSGALPMDYTSTYGYEWVPLTLDRTGDHSFSTSFPGGEKGYYMIRVDVKPPLYDYIFPNLPNPDPNWKGVIFTYDIFNLDGWETWDYDLIMQMEYYETNCSVQISDQFTTCSSSGTYTSKWKHNIR